MFTLQVRASLTILFSAKSGARGVTLLSVLTSYNQRMNMTIVVVALAWALVFGIGCLLRTVFAIHWKGYIHVLIPIFGFIACLTTILGFALPEDKSTKAVLASIIAWICCVVVAAGLILLSFFVFTDLKRNKVMEGVRNTALYIVLWLLFTDLLCVVTIIIDVLATVASYKIWKNKKE